MFDREGLTDLINITYALVGMNLKGMTESEMLASPEGGGNHGNWVMGHLLAGRDVQLAALASDHRCLNEKESELYGRGSEKVAPELYPAVEDLHTRFKESQDILLKALAESSDKLLAEEQVESSLPPGFQRNTWDRVRFMQFHESYHCGQLGTLRTMSGKPGAI